MTLTQEAREHIKFLKEGMYVTVKDKRTMSLIEELIKAIDRRDHIIAGGVSKPMQDALLGGMQ